MQDILFSVHALKADPNHLKENGTSYVMASDAIAQEQLDKLMACRNIIEAKWYAEIHMVCGIVSASKTKVRSQRLFGNIHLLMPEYFAAVDNSSAILYSEELMNRCLTQGVPIRPLSMSDMLDCYESEGLVVAAWIDD